MSQPVYVCLALVVISACAFLVFRFALPHGRDSTGIVPSRKGIHASLDADTAIHNDRSASVRLAVSYIVDAGATLDACSMSLFRGRKTDVHNLRLLDYDYNILPATVEEQNGWVVATFRTLPAIQGPAQYTVNIKYDLEEAVCTNGDGAAVFDASWAGNWQLPVKNSSFSLGFGHKLIQSLGPSCSAADKKVWHQGGHKGFKGDMDQCARGCTGSGDCVTKCFEKKHYSGGAYSHGCAACFGGLTSCTVSNCMLQCMGGASAGCSSCVNSAGCNRQWAFCTGFSSQVHGGFDVCAHTKSALKPAPLCVNPMTSDKSSAGSAANAKRQDSLASSMRGDGIVTPDRRLAAATLKSTGSGLQYFSDGAIVDLEFTWKPTLHGARSCSGFPYVKAFAGLGVLLLLCVLGGFYFKNSVFRACASIVEVLPKGSFTDMLRAYLSGYAPLATAVIAPADTVVPAAADTSAIAPGDAAANSPDKTAANTPGEAPATVPAF